MPALMVQGVSSSAGKSLLATALARALSRRGVDVVPFKAQNMSNNARVARGGEMGTAQYLQALAAGLEPDVLMNPILVKPEGDNRSQVVILGRPDLELSRLPWRSRPDAFWPVIQESLKQLQARHEFVLLEGAGSPAETNLQDTDLANMRTAELAGADALLVADIDRGGAFAHLYGTWAMVPEDQRSRIVGFVLNKFRGDLSLLAPAPEDLCRMTGVPTLGVVPWLHHGLPDEDGAAITSDRRSGPSVTVVRYPTASNLDEFKRLEQVASLRWGVRPEDLTNADLVILPGSKHVAADLRWLYATGIAEAVRDRAEARRSILGICGGMQMLGERIEDLAGVDGAGNGLGLLPLQTTFTTAKLTEHTSTRFERLSGPWAALSGVPVSGYQIRHGETTASRDAEAALPAGLGFSRGSVLGIYLHGALETSEVLEALFHASPRTPLEDTFERLADAIEECIDITALLRMAGQR